MKALVTVVGIFLFTACGSAEPISPELADTGSRQTGPAPAPQKLGDLDRVPYRSTNCSAIVSGSEDPPQLIVSGRCYGYGRIDYTMQCPQSSRNCSQVYKNGARAEATISENFAQITILVFAEDGDREFGESFLVEKSK